MFLDHFDLNGVAYHHESHEDHDGAEYKICHV